MIDKSKKKTDAARRVVWVIKVKDDGLYLRDLDARFGPQWTYDRKLALEFSSLSLARDNLRHCPNSASILKRKKHDRVVLTGDAALMVQALREFGEQKVKSLFAELYDEDFQFVGDLVLALATP